MKKQELLKIIDNELLEKLFGFCYVRTSDSYEAQELCSDIVFALVKTANTNGDIKDLYPFIWQIARNTYADFCKKRSKFTNCICFDNLKELFFSIVPQEDDNNDELLKAIYRQISFLTKAYREVMIQYYIDGLSTAKIAQLQNTSEVAIRQRLFSARKKIRSEVEKMEKINNKPVSLDPIQYVFWGTGNPWWGDPRHVCTRQLSRHIIWICRKKPMSPIEIANKLNVPTIYVEEELEILIKGTNGTYGLLRKLDNGKYIINFILLDRNEIEMANKIYIDSLPVICNVICEYIEKHKEQYLKFPYINKNIDFNLILWQQISAIGYAFSENVERILSEKYFADIKQLERPFSVFAYLENGKYYGSGWDSVRAENICGYSKVELDDIYITCIKKHFGCGLYIEKDKQIQLALRAINGLDITTLSEDEKEHAAKAIECGYLYSEGETLYTKILVSDIKDKDKLFDISRGLKKGIFETEAEIVAAKIAELIRKIIPEYLLAEWKFVNNLANLPVIDAIVEILIKKGFLIPPKDGIGAEGCWMSVSK